MNPIFVAAPSPSIPPHKGEGGHRRNTISVKRNADRSFATLTSPSPLWGGVWGGGMPSTTFQKGL